MQNQIEVLEELLARVQRNRVHLTSASSDIDMASRFGGISAQPHVAESYDDEEATEAEIPDTEEIIDLVNPTSIPPANGMADSVANGSSLVPLSIAPSPVVDRVEAEANVSVPPSDDPFDSVARAEDDFSSVAPTSIVPGVPRADVDDMLSAEQPSIMPVTEPQFAFPPFSEDIEADDNALVESAEETDDSVPAEVEVDVEAEVEIAAEVEPTTGSPSVLERRDEINMAPSIPETLVRREFQSAAAASGDIVAVQNELPRQKLWTIDAVLQRAWYLGKNL